MNARIKWQKIWIFILLICRFFKFSENLGSCYIFWLVNFFSFASGFIQMRNLERYHCGLTPLSNGLWVVIYHKIEVLSFIKIDKLKNKSIS
jgi:hypothetical protein